MHISRVHVQNFRNFSNLDLQFAQHAVIVGENKVGKSNLLFAIRLVLDPTLPETARYLRHDDFWDGLPQPLKKDDVIEISVELADFEGDDELLALLAEHFVSADPLVSRLTYRYQPVDGLEGHPTSEGDYEYLFFGGGNVENPVSSEVRRRIPLDMFGALRDAEADLERWRRSPLRPLLDRAASELDRDRLIEIAGDVESATQTLANQSEITRVAEKLNQRIREMAGMAQALDTTLGFAPTDPEKLIRSLRLFIDGGSRAIADASLGSANVLYLALRTLERQQLIEDGQRNFSIVAIEEPEAHLHPHLQRLVYGDFLQTRKEAGGDGRTPQEAVLLTTHSPHIVSVAPIHSLVVLKRRPDAAETEGYSAASLELDAGELADIERYLDVSRGEIIFARRVLLVEGLGEQYLVPAFARSLGVDLDEHGVSICGVGGTNFRPYVLLLGENGIRTQFAVLTDLDPVATGSGLGVRRARRLLRLIVEDNTTLPEDEEELRTFAQGHGVFVNHGTLETEVWSAGGIEEVCRTLSELAPSKRMRERAEQLRADGEEADMDVLMKDITRIGKGRFAQRLASHVDSAHCPDYIRSAVEYVTE